MSSTVERRVAARQQVVVEDQDLVGLDAAGVRRVGDEDLRLRVVDAVADAVVAVEDRHREQDRAGLEGAEEGGGGLGGRRQQHRDAVTLLYTVRAQHVREAVRPLLQLAPADLADRALEVLVDHRELVGRVLVAAVDGDVVALGHAPLVRGDGFLVGPDIQCHRSSSPRRPRLTILRVAGYAHQTPTASDRRALAPCAVGG